MPDQTHEPPVLEISGLCLSYYTRAGEVPAVYDFDLTVAKGESVGLVGESGCGKSTVANGIMRYMGHNGAIVGGTIKFKGRDMAEMSEEEIRRVRGKDNRHDLSGADGLAQSEPDHRRPAHGSADNP